MPSAKWTPLCGGLRSEGYSCLQMKKLKAQGFDSAEEDSLVEPQGVGEKSFGKVRSGQGSDSDSPTY